MASVRAPSTADLEALHAELKKFLVDHLRLTEVDPDSIASDAPLVGGALELDSIDVLELVTGVERRYGLRIEDPDLVRRVFRNVSTLADHIARSRAGA